MRKKPLIGVSIGLGFAGLSYGTVSFLGYNSTSYTILAYLYVSLSFILTAFYELDSFGGLKNLTKNFVVVVEEDEKKLKRVFTGEKYKIKGEVEKVQSE